MGIRTTKYGPVFSFGTNENVDVTAPNFLLDTTNLMAVRVPETADFQVNGVGPVGVMPGLSPEMILEGTTSLKFTKAMTVSVMKN